MKRIEQGEKVRDQCAIPQLHMYIRCGTGHIPMWHGSYNKIFVDQEPLSSISSHVLFKENEEMVKFLKAALKFSGASITNIGVGISFA